ncbi:hypothetical protein VTK26DRAFT_7961 [Humicola hyalothermophila]
MRPQQLCSWQQESPTRFNQPEGSGRNKPLAISNLGDVAPRLGMHARTYTTSKQPKSPLKEGQVSPGAAAEVLPGKKGRRPLGKVPRFPTRNCNPPPGLVDSPPILPPTASTIYLPKMQRLFCSKIRSAGFCLAGCVAANAGRVSRLRRLALIRRGSGRPRVVWNLGRLDLSAVSKAQNQKVLNRQFPRTKVVRPMDPVSWNFERGNLRMATPSQTCSHLSPAFSTAGRM